MKRSTKLSPGRRLARLGLCLGAVVLAVAALTAMFGNAILNGYGKRKAESAFAAAHPGMVVLQTGIGGTRVVDMLPGDQLPRIC